MRRREHRLKCKNLALARRNRELRKENTKLAEKVSRLESKKFFYTKRLGYKIFSLLDENRVLRIRERAYLMTAIKLLLSIPKPVQTEACLHGKLSADEIKFLCEKIKNFYGPKRIRALIVIFHLCGLPRLLISECLNLYRRTVKRHLLAFRRGGISGVFPQKEKIKRWRDPQLKEILFKMLHSPPTSHGFNRTTWRQKDLAACMRRRGTPISKNNIGKMVREAGYRYMKAREVLTSNDPNYREKVEYIQMILRELQPSERFFSIDEFGPVAIKHQTGRKLVGPGEYPTVPQFQKSKGCLIVTAALELSQNQVTHFYSTGKNTDEMIKLLKILQRKYKKCSRLYFSWDAAGWHESKRFLATVHEVNSSEYRKLHDTPIVELAPLPARAQFLNVIESIFNGLAISVIHNSNYASIEEAKAAIDRYFRERNAHFRKNPKRAGNKIWGNERVPSTFSEAHCCKNPAYR